MKTTGTCVAVLAALVLGAPGMAQKMGNRNAPTVSSSIAFHNGASLEVKYTAINWAQGQTVKSATDPEAGEAMRTRINAAAEANPLGELTIKGGATIGDKKVGEGAWKLAFTVDAEGKWHLMLKQGETKLDFPLPLEEQDKVQSRLHVSLAPADKATAAELKVRFGNLAAKLPVSAMAAAEKSPEKEG